MTSIIISTKNRLSYLQELIKSIREFTKNYEIVVIDDASTDGTREWGEKEHITYIRNHKSIPVAEAWNQGARFSEGEYLVFLNDDMLVTEGWLDSMIEMYTKNPMTGSLAFKVYDDQGNVQSRGHSFKGLTPYIPDKDAITVDWSDHPFVSRKVYNRVGGFDIMGQIYYEDTAFGIKLLSRGYRNYYNPNAVLIHQTVGTRIGTDEEKEIRKHNEQVLQKQSGEKFYKLWGDFLKSRK